ncbi:DNA phosphorothioation-dependent restriction protein DptF [Pedobacter psychrodurus]|uniref:DNA phosphorothioation-dependent restriction protein DptF n=1 Tax=Pedobacter psychrodurus TaxID=2530456 RepID=A0A4R0Q0Y5_9SPHI|nr:DNA phosphorothioation-dependent restriction protein DptF [Pedobacter psychrodurus]TCD28636.1 DNA phosphorothioation-dependent restriction protein DptF [Pedobacter psychrodurus]
MNFKQYLDTLKLSSKDAIVDGEEDSLSDLKKYLHIERNVEKDLVNQLLAAQQAEGSQLIFLMGNVGDGKSHLMAKMWEDHPQCMAEFNVYNDATESLSPDKTYLENLDEVFLPYTDSALESPASAVKTIIAINLGTLTNFLEETKLDFVRLRDYIVKNQLIERKVRFDEPYKDTAFQALNLTDYHIFVLKVSGMECQVLTSIIQRITAKDAANPFYSAYLEYYQNHPHTDQCPIKYNYDLLSSPVVQQSLGELLVKIVLSDKLIVSVRLLMNWIYDLIVSPTFSSLSLEEITDRTGLRAFVTEFYDHSLPSLLFDSSSTSFILKSIRAHEPVSTSNEGLEMLMIKLGTSSSPVNYFLQYNLIPEDGIFSQLIPLMDIKQKLPLFLRLHFLLKSDLGGGVNDDYFRDFLHNLYWFNLGDFIKLLPLYEQVKYAVYHWNGTAAQDHINLNIGKKQSAYKISQKMELDPSPVDIGKSTSQEMQKFCEYLLVGFKISPEGYSELEIDYNLYRLIRNINKGYRPNRIDKSVHLKFSQFVERLTKYRSQTKELTIQEFTGEIRKKFSLQYTPGFEHFKFIEIE